LHFDIKTNYAFLFNDHKANTIQILILLNDTKI